MIEGNLDCEVVRLFAACRLAQVMLERGGHVWKPKCGLPSRPFTNLPVKHRQLSKISPLSIT